MPAGFAKFLVLECPDEIVFYNESMKMTVGIKRYWEYPAEMHSTVPFHRQSVPTVALDSWINPHDTSAAMVFPADEYTKVLFNNKSRPTRDHNGALVIHTNFNLVRWVEPENMRVLRYFELERRLGVAP